MRGVALVVAVTIVSGSRRLPPLCQRPAADGLSRVCCPSEPSSGSTIRRGGITKAGNALARRMLIEGAWTYRLNVRVGRKLHDRLEPLPGNPGHRVESSGPAMCAISAFGRIWMLPPVARPARVSEAAKDRDPDQRSGAQKPCGFAAALGRRHASPTTPQGQPR